MLTKFGRPLLNHKVEIYVGVKDATLWDESSVVKGLVVQCLTYQRLMGVRLGEGFFALVNSRGCKKYDSGLPRRRALRLGEPERVLKIW